MNKHLENQRPQSSRYEECIRNLTAFCLTIAFLVITALIVQQLYHSPQKPLAELGPLFLHPEGLSPEPKERTVYLVLILLLMPAIIASLRITEAFRGIYDVQRSQNRGSVGTYFQMALILVVSVLSAVPFWKSNFMDLILGGEITNYRRLYLWGAALLSVSLLSPYILPQQAGNLTKRIMFFQSQTVTTVLAVVSVGVILISVLSFRVHSVSMADESGRNHFEAMFYSVSQVIGGKTLLADLPSQYGLYAEILNPIFAIVRLSVLNFTVIMSLLQIIGFSALLWACFRLVRNNVLRLLCVVGGFIVIGSTWWAINAEGYADPYYQYWPFRFVFPAVAVIVFQWAVKRRFTIIHIVIMSLFGALAIIWNLDSGVPVAGSFIAYLLVQVIFPHENNRGRQMIKLLLAGATVVLFLAGFAFYLQYKAGRAIAWLELFKYQQLFYKAGYFMMPIPVSFHPWMVVTGYYVFGIVGALYMRIRHKPSIAWDVIFYLSVLGLGLFSYYQGRSHEAVFTAVIWPAILIAFILADRTLRSVRARVLPAILSWSALPVILFGLVLTGVFVEGLPVLKSMTRANWKAVLNPRKTPVTENVQFIRQHAGSAKRAAILAPYQATYFAETGLASAVNGPGIAETILVADQARMIDSLIVEPVEHLFIQSDQNAKVPQIYARLLGRYHVKGLSEYGMLYLEP